MLSMCFANNSYSQSDTLAHPLEEVDVTASKTVYEVIGSMQVINNEQLKALPAIQISDALKFMSGIVVKDYGGVGGIKTVSVRGFGAQHTAVTYDGMMASDCQTGQIDLSRYTMDNMGSISVVSGNPETIFMPARFFSSASLLNIQSKQPSFEEKKPVNVQVDLTGGSFGYLSPSFLLENNILRRKKDGKTLLASSLFVNYMQSQGEYPFVIHYGDEGDSTSRETRSNTDIKALTAELNLFFHFNTHSKLNAKAYYYDSQRGLPGPIVFYNMHASQRLWDRNAFGQMHYENYFNEKWVYQLNVKYNYAYQRYLDPDYLNDAGKADYIYEQQEGYLSNAVLYKPHYLVSLSISNDLIYNTMESNSPYFAEPFRFSSLTALSASFNHKKVNIHATLLHTYAFNAVKQGEAADNVNRFSPSVNFSFRPWYKEHFLVRIFYKNIFRQPTFNDLYYHDVGSVDLKPENTHQVDAGVEYQKAFTQKVKISCSLDGYYNQIENKIVALPVRNLFYWSMYNLGKVEIGGFDAHLSCQYRIIPAVGIEFSGNYAYQYAVDRTNIQDKVYNHQIPYTPRHSGSVVFSIRTQWIDVAYTLIASGKRYCQAYNVEKNLMPAYTDHCLVLGHDFKIRKVVLGLKIELLNLADNHYEVIRFYPMQGRSFRAKILFRY